MTKEKIQECLKKLDELADFYSKSIQDPNGISEDAIIDWVADCTSLFSEIGVNEAIISSFLDYFSFKTQMVKVEPEIRIHAKDIEADVRTIGPFKQKAAVIGVGYFEDVSITSGFFLEQGHRYPRIAFQVARTILLAKQEDERLIPSALINVIAEDQKIAHLVSFLQAMESAYQHRDAKALITDTTSLLDSILSLDGELKGKGLVGPKLYFLASNKKAKQRLGVSDDIVNALNNSRIIRNERIVHKELSLRVDIPFMVALSFAFLTIHFFDVIQSCKVEDLIKI